MLDAPMRVYWDANVFLAYINGESSERMPILDAILDRAQSKEILLFTSVLCIAEVVFANTEQQRKVLDPTVEQSIDALWADRNVIRLVEFHELIARDSRSIMRAALAIGRSIKPMDALHLATARSIGVAEFHTYDAKLLRYPEPLGFKVCEPYTPQPRLPIPT